MKRSLVAALAVTGLALLLAGSAQAGAIHAGLQFPSFGGASESLNEDGVRASNYSAFFGSGGGFPTFPTVQRNDCGNDFFAQLICTVIQIDVHEVIEHIATNIPHVHFSGCVHLRPPTNPVPEPSAAVVFGLGALIVGSRSRRR